MGFFLSYVGSFWGLVVGEAGGRKRKPLNCLTFWRGYSPKSSLTVGNARGHRDGALSPLRAAESCLSVARVQSVSGKHLKAGLAFGCPPAQARAPRLSGEGGAALSSLHGFSA